MAYEAKQYYQDDEVADDYDRARFRGLRGAIINWLDQRLLMKAVEGLTPRGRVLDLPIGTGRMARRLTSAGYQAIGADISVPMMRLAQKLAAEEGLRADIVRADGEELPFVDKAFDGAVCFRLMSHLPPESREKILRELGRVAHRVIAVYQPHKASLWWLINSFLLRKNIPLHFASAEELNQEFQRSGLRIVRSHTLLRWFFMQRAYVLEPNPEPVA